MRLFVILLLLRGASGAGLPQFGDSSPPPAPLAASGCPEPNVTASYSGANITVSVETTTQTFDESPSGLVPFYLASFTLEDTYNLSPDLDAPLGSVQLSPQSFAGACNLTRAGEAPYLAGKFTTLGSLRAAPQLAPGFTGAAGIAPQLAGCEANTTWRVEVSPSGVEGCSVRTQATVVRAASTVSSYASPEQDTLEYSLNVFLVELGVDGMRTTTERSLSILLSLSGGVVISTSFSTAAQMTLENSTSRASH